MERTYDHYDPGLHERGDAARAVRVSIYLISKTMKQKRNVIRGPTITVPPEANYNYKTPSQKQWYLESIQRAVKPDRFAPVKNAFFDFLAGWGAAALFWRFWPTSLYTMMVGYGAYRRLEHTSREPIPRSVRLFVWQRDRGQCVQCGSREQLEFDHIIALASGGSSTERNIQLLCEACNRSKGSTI